MHRVFYAILFYTLLMVLLFLLKPAMLFTSDGDIRSFGLDHNQTVVSLGSISVVLGVVCFYVIATIDYLFGGM